MGAYCTELARVVQSSAPDCATPSCATPQCNTLTQALDNLRRALECFSQQPSRACGAIRRQTDACSRVVFSQALAVVVAAAKCGGVSEKDIQDRLEEQALASESALSLTDVLDVLAASDIQTRRLPVLIATLTHSKSDSALRTPAVLEALTDAELIGNQVRGLAVWVPK